MSAGNEYIIGGGIDGKSRLNTLAGMLHNATASLLQNHGLRAGGTMLDAGCGGGNVSMMAAEIVGPGGRVVAVDFDDSIISLARQDAKDKSLNNISFEVKSAYDIDYNNEFDIAYSRFLLSHLQHPEMVLAKLVAATKPGATIVIEDVQFSGHFCYPACSAFDQYVQYYRQMAEHNGQNPEIGPRLPGLLKTTGLTDVGFDMIQPCFSTGEGKWMAWLTLDRIKSALVNSKIATDNVVQQTLAELEAFTRDPNTIISLPRIFRVWGQKPI